ncbi:uncharacterized protein A1O9_11676 [Exophiala aquamarina CBS 119918]|uniref:Uncharacterized protein n=1 Tax=Exophiala aquamarina CBS 119918 TaxID=1182545 RepID=A0A072PA43_9EURO|nr:uncharacterized protein A1O9_11676 [Exophiala aquamarina CBS 119918]KEF52435.1 hypothetical protein A1O9_11676 [Exophiala aquamarina CBS 119918]
MSTEKHTIRIVDKTHYDRQYFVTPSTDNLGPLDDSSVRIQSTILGLSSNNLAYCASGKVLHWWDTFPVPEFVEAPYNDRSQYGISPGWGYATILESTIPTLKNGSLLWGFFPISTFPVDLFLQQSPKIQGHFIEISEHRAKVMPLYQRYISVSDTLESVKSETSPGVRELAWKSALLPPWKSAYTFNRFAFASLPGDPVLHPGIGHPWSPEDADLKRTLVICLGAGTKTCRSFVHQLTTKRAPGSGPVAVLEVSSAAPELSPFASFQSEVQIKSIKYADLHSGTSSDWLFAQSIDRFVIVDFAGRAGVCEPLSNQLRANKAGIKVEVLIVGGESKVYTPEDLAERQAIITRLGAVRCNASAIREDAQAAIGEARFFSDQDAAFDELLQEQLANGSDAVLGVKLGIHKGLRGAEGIEGGWDRVCTGNLKGDEGLAFLLW